MRLIGLSALLGKGICKTAEEKLREAAPDQTKLPANKKAPR